MKKLSTLFWVLCIGLFLLCYVPPTHAWRTAYRAVDTNLCVSIKHAITAYKIRFGSLPIPLGTPQKDGVVYFGAEYGKPPTEVLPGTVEFFNALCGNINAKTGASAQTGLNPRNKAYLKLENIDRIDSNGVPIQIFPYNGKNAYFSIAIRIDDSGKLNLPQFTNSDFFDAIDDDAAVWCCNDQPYDKPNRRWSHSW